MALSTDIFISYAADTKPMAEALTSALEREGIQTWADFKDLKPGQRWKDEIENALNKARSFIILVSPYSQSTRWAEVEWRMALEKAWSDSEKLIIPVVVGGGDTPPFLRDWIPLRVDPKAEPARWIGELLEILRSARNRAVHGNSSREQQERRERFEEMAHATEEWRKLESGDLPADS